MIDPMTVQVLFADLQPPIVARSRTNPPASLTASAVVLARCARLLGIPVHHSVVPEGGNAPEILPELAEATAGAPQLTRMAADPFVDAPTRDTLKAAGRPVLVIAGFATEVVVLHAALSAIAAGFRAQVVIDACGGMSARTEDAALRQIEAAGGITTSVVTLVTAMAPDLADEPGRSSFAELQTLRLA